MHNMRSVRSCWIKFCLEPNITHSTKHDPMFLSRHEDVGADPPLSEAAVATKSGDRGESG